jgi:crotonobetainyl-CoA:carnitine CoA-transferase CaiB-like acyl-CoA transferase
MSGPLAGVRILDLSAVVSGPLTAALLADQGAQVIKVERAGEGDIQRHVGSSRNGFSGFFHVLNRGKRSIALDLKRERGREIVRALALRADALIENYRPGALGRIGLGPDALLAAHPRLVYLSITGFGSAGPLAERRAYDPIIQAHAGVAHVQGRVRGEGPEQVQQLLADKLTALCASQALVSALFARERSGRGQHVEVSMLDAVVAFLWPDAASDRILLGPGVDVRPPIGAAGNLARYADGFGVTMTLSDAEFAGWCRAYGLADLLEDVRFATVAARVRHREALRELYATRVAGVARELTLAEAEGRFAAEQVPFARVLTLADLERDPQVRASGLLVESEHPVAGRLREARPAPRFAATPAFPGGPAPRAGEHTREILRELGLTAEIDALLRDGVVSEPPRT